MTDAVTQQRKSVQKGELLYERLQMKNLPLLYKFYKKGLLPEQHRNFMPHPSNRGICLFLYICMLIQQRLKKALYILAFKKDEPMPVGFILLRNFRKNKAELGIGVSYQYQGRGYGSLLLNKIISIAREMKFRKLLLRHALSNYQAEKLYKKFGFQDYGEKRYVTLTFGIRKEKLMVLDLKQ